MNVRVVYQFEGDAWHISSPDIQGWVGGAKTLVEARKLAISLFKGEVAYLLRIFTG